LVRLGGEEGIDVHILIGSETEARHVYNEIFLQRDYLQYGVRVEGGRVGGRGVGWVVDVGANIGLFALHCLAQCPAHDPVRRV
jgi:hypothetical protein